MTRFDNTLLAMGYTKTEIKQLQTDINDSLSAITETVQSLNNDYYLDIAEAITKLNKPSVKQIVKVLSDYDISKKVF